MKALISIAFIIFLLSAAVLAVQLSPTPTGSPQPAKTEHSSNNSSHNGGYIDARAAFLPDGTAVRYLVLRRVADPLYREPTKDELAAIAPNTSFSRLYSTFLNEPHTGLFRLVADAKCGEEATLVSARNECLKFTMPGGGSSYSFRTGNYRLGRLADLTFSSNAFHTSGILTHGILVKLGEVPIESVTMQTRGIRYLADFQPSADLEEAKRIEKQLANGIIADGFLYSCALTATDGTTYVLRTIAYRGKSLRAMDGVVFNELDFDKRKDVTIVFRIVNRAEDGSVMILWKLLDKKNSPKIKRKPLAKKKLQEANS